MVLALFLGGISAGYLVFGRWSRYKKWNLLLAYAVVELLLAAWGFCFPYFFKGALPLVSRLYGWVGVESLLIDVLISALLIGFPTFLMGGTLPLLTQGLSENLDDASETHARIYGFNTVGACAGSLLCGYILIPLTDLGVATAIAASLNTLVAFFTYFLFARWQPLLRDVAPSSARERASMLTPQTLALLAIGFLSGFYILTLETVFIRLMGLSTGSSNYNFTLIVSLFVFGLGIGSLVARRIARYSRTRLLWNQLGVAILLLALYISGDYWPYWVHRVRIVFRDVAQNFFWYQAGLGAFFLALLAVPIGLCGLTMPLCFHLIKDRKETLGHRVGQLYGLNTLGCVLGALGGGYGLLHIVNLDQLFRLCVLLAIVTAVLALYYCNIEKRVGTVTFALATTFLSLTLFGTLLAPSYHKEYYTQPFRQQAPVASSYSGAAAWGEYLSSTTEYVFYKDGPNTSVGIGISKSNGTERSRTIFVNGKSDGNTRGDLLTMSLTGHIPALMARKLDNVCAIGFGTGISAGAFTRYKELGHVDLVEIADTIVNNAHHFDSYNGGVSKHPKIEFHVMDAFRFIGGTTKRFDVIVSEPSNPWVAGVENLFSAEFYDIAKSKLTDDGVFVQWVQGYSFSDELLKMVFKTISSRFPHVLAFQMLDHDLALVASRTPFSREDVQRSVARYEANRDARRSLAELGITRMETFLGYEIIPSGLIPVLSSDAEEHHLEAPRLSHQAARAFFVGSSAKVHSLRRSMKEFFPSVKKSLLSLYLDGKTPSRETLEAMRATYCDHPTGKAATLCEETVVMGKWDHPLAPFETTYASVLSAGELRTVASFASLATAPRLKAFGLNDLKEVQNLFDLYKRFHSPVCPLPSRPLVERLDNCLRVSGRNAEIHGDCLLQKAAILEIVEPEDPPFLATIREFDEWFAGFPPDSEGYSRFKKASEILADLAQKANSSNSSIR